MAANGVDGRLEHHSRGGQGCGWGLRHAGYGGSGGDNAALLGGAAGWAATPVTPVAAVTAA
ncbi:hypothetical protein, partial [Mycobacterium interjectum]|uniref:hypothetical protein n=1 Tax=Mycobacterium interjectum TaxID=33895 RepID=UPI0021F2FC5B